MLEKMFLQVINMSYIGSIVIIFISIARLLLKKAPKKYSYILWAVALFRLIIPISFESVSSLIPVNPDPIPNDILFDTTPNINTGIPNIDQSISNSLPAADVVASVNSMQIWTFWGSMLWILGIAILLIYGMMSLIRIKGKLENATFEKDNIYRSDNVTTPFVLGLIQPKIYMPAFLSESEKEYILLHEQTHIKRFDHVIRFISYLALCIHWFNPLVWIAFWMSGKDMEMSCDESVISRLGHGVKKDYSQSLLNLATGRMGIGVTPLAFGERDTKGRIKNIINLKQPKFLIVTLSLIILITAFIGLMTDPKKDSSMFIPPDKNMELTFITTDLVYQNDGGTSYSLGPIGPLFIFSNETLEVRDDEYEYTESYNISYNEEPLTVDSFRSQFLKWHNLPDISTFKNKAQYDIVASTDESPGYRLYVLDDQYWIATLYKDNVWRIVSVKTM